jgi:hypothetical protein
MADPKKIEFEDDIVLTIRAFIKKTNQISPVMWTLFPLLIKVFEKNKRTFGNLLDTLNQYIIIGKQQLGLKREFLQLLVQMSTTSIFSTEPAITVHNSEGAILMQLLFQVYAGTSVLDEFFEGLMNQVLTRMNT